MFVPRTVSRNVYGNGGYTKRAGGSGALTNPRITPPGAFHPGDVKTLHASTWPGSPSITRTWEKQTGTDPWTSIGSYADNDTIGTTQGNVSLSDEGYRFRLKDENNDTGKVVYSSPTQPLTLNIPAAPTLTATPGDSLITLDWNAVSAATSYKIYRNGSLLDTTTSATTYDDTTAVNGTSYAYAVKACNASGDSDDSNVVAATPVWVVSGLDLDSATTTTLNISFSANTSPDPDHFDVEWQLGGGDWTSPIDDTTIAGTNRSGTISGLDAETTYDVRVRAHDGANVGEWAYLNNVSTGAAASAYADYPLTADAGDVSGNSRDGTNHDGVIFDPVDGATFDGTNYLSVPAPFLDDAGDMSFMLWVKAPADSQGSSTRVLQKTPGSVDSGWLLAPNIDGGGDNNYLDFYAPNPAQTGVNHVTTAIPVFDDTWHLICVRYTAATPLLEIAVDDGSFVSYSDVPMLPCTEEMDTGGPGLFFTGQIKGERFFNSVINTSVRDAFYAAGP